MMNHNRNPEKAGRRKTPVVVRPIRPDEVHLVAALVESVFRHDIAPLFDESGVREFLRYADVEALSLRLEKGAQIHVALSADVIVGIIEMRSARHIAMLFVDPKHQRSGIGRELLSSAIERSRERLPGLTDVTANAAPNSIHAYEHYGFVRTGSQRTKNGIVYVPMTLKLSRP